MTALWWLRFRFALRRHGWPAMLGALLLALSWPVAYVAADGARARAEALQRAGAAQRARPPQPDAQARAAAQVAEFHQRLPDAAVALEAVQRMHQSAADHGLALAAGEYRLVREAAPGVQRYQITLPADGPYPALRAWMADVLNALPTVALDEFSVARRSVGDIQVQARVRWSLYLRAP